MVKIINSKKYITIPEGVTVTVIGRKVKVQGPRGVLERNFNHIHCVIEHQKTKKIIKVEIWFGTSKQVSAIRTICTHIQNMFTGVTKGYEYKMRFVYAHFPVNAIVSNDGKCIEIRNFLGEKILRKVPLLEGVKAIRSEKVKDELVLSGNNLEMVSQSAANVQQSTKVFDKDIRKFLDGIYVSERNVIGQ